ncbi:MAG: leucyl/phenylalanyl-tRNA--protein transferase [Gemmataceae bacterium]
MFRFAPRDRYPELRPELADESGLVAIGGNLQPARLLEAYRRGIFPWYDEDLPVCWWSPDPRAIFEFDGLHVARRLQRTLRSSRFTVTANLDFAGVMQGCACRAEGTWITREMYEAYLELHRLGHAHSLEVWCTGQLVGGIYGVALGGFFAGESMFSFVSDASKVALVHLVDRLNTRGYQLFDIQMLTDHTRRLGAIEIPRVEYLRRLRQALAQPVTFS